MKPGISKISFLVCIAAMVGISLAIVTPLFAATKEWNNAGTLGDWSTGSNWNGGEPGPSDEAQINNGGTANISQSETVSKIFLGFNNSTSGFVNQTAGTVTTTQIQIGFGGGSSGAGSYVQSGGTNQINGDLYLGYNEGSAGTYTLSGGTLSAQNELNWDGNITFNQSDGTNTVDRLYLGNRSSNTGTYNQSGGTANVTYDLYLGNGTNADGTYNLSGGTLNVGNINICYGGSGTLTVTNGAAINMNGSWRFDYSSGQTATFNTSSGTVNFTASGGTQTLASGGTDNAFWDLTHSGNSLLQITGGNRPENAALKVKNNFLSTAGNVNFDKDVDIDGNVTVTNSILAATESGPVNLNVGGSWNVSAGTFYERTSTVTFDATTTGKTINNGSNTFYKVLFDGVGGGWTLQSGLAPTSGTLNVKNGTLTTGSNNVTASTLCIGSIGSSGTFAGTGTYNQSGGTTAVTSNLYLGALTGSAGTYNQSGGTATISGYLYLGNETGSAGVYNLSGGTLNVGHVWAPASNSGTLTVTNGATINVSKSWDVRNATFDTSSGTVNFNAATNSYNLQSGGTDNAFYNLTHSGAGLIAMVGGSTPESGAVRVKGDFLNTAGSFSMYQHNLYVDGNLTLTAGYLEAGNADGTAVLALHVGGNWDVSGGTFQERQSTVTFDGTTAGKTIKTGSNKFYNLVFDGVGGEWTLQNNLRVDGTMSVQNGTFNSGTYTVTVAGGNVVTGGGVFNVNGSVTGTSTTLTVSNGGTVKGSGTLSNMTLTLASGGILAPGNSPGNLEVSGGTMQWLGGSHYELQVLHVEPDDPGNYEPGEEWDQVTLTTGAVLDIDATVGNKYVIDVIGLLSANPDIKGNPTDFDPTMDYAWLFLDYTAGSLAHAFNANVFSLVLDPAGFTNATGTFGIANYTSYSYYGSTVDGFFVTYTGASAVPEPATVVSVIVGALFAFRRKVYKRRA